MSTQKHMNGDNHCFICGRDLGPELEWMKMRTERGPICYVCFNEVTGNPIPDPKENDSK